MTAFVRLSFDSVVTAGGQGQMPTVSYISRSLLRATGTRTYELMSPQTLVTRVLDGDRNALDYLTRAYGQFVERNVSRYIRNPEDARDVAQEVWLAVMLNLRGLRDRAAFSAWLKQVTRTACLDALDERRAQDSESPDEDIELNAAFNPIRMEFAINSGTLRDLSRAQASVIYLRYFCDFTLVVTASLLDMPVGTVKSHESRAKKLLAASIAADSSSPSEPLSAG